MKIIDDWAQAWRLLSVQIATFAAAFQIAVLSDSGLEELIGDKWVHIVTLATSFAIILGRLVKQQSPQQ